MFSARLPQLRFHSKTDQTSQEAANAVTNRQQSQGKLSFLGRNVLRRGMGRMDNNHPRHETKRRAESDDDPNIGDEMVPRLKEKEDQMSHFQYCNIQNKLSLI